MTEINESHDTLVLGIEITLAEEAVLECDSSRLVDYSLDFKVSDFGSVEKGLSLHVRAVGGNCED